MDNQFKVGDKVKHKGSGQQAVVTAIRTKCIKHTALEHTRIAFWKTFNMANKLGDCDEQYFGYIDVQFDVNQPPSLVKGDLFEIVKE